MHKLLSILFVLFLCLCFTLGSCAAIARGPNTIDTVLDSAEQFFLSLKNRNLELVWHLLTIKSRETIISDVYKASRKMGGEITREEIGKDFENGGVVSSNYWNAFLNTFDPDMILEESRWEIGPVKDNKAEVVITHRKSRDPAILRVFREDNIWRVGLVETFWTRKSL